MQKIDIKKDLRHGDLVNIAQLTGFSYEYVKKVLNPTDKRYNEKIMEVAQKVIKKRTELENELTPKH